MELLDITTTGPLRLLILSLIRSCIILVVLFFHKDRYEEFYTCETSDRRIETPIKPHKLIGLLRNKDSADDCTFSKQKLELGRGGVGRRLERWIEEAEIRPPNLKLS